jgi:hypothetical protein
VCPGLCSQLVPFLRRCAQRVGLRLPARGANASRGGDGVRGPRSVRPDRTRRHPGPALEQAAGRVRLAAPGLDGFARIRDPALVRLGCRPRRARRLPLRLRPAVPAGPASFALRVSVCRCAPPAPPLRERQRLARTAPAPLGPAGPAVRALGGVPPDIQPLKQVQQQFSFSIRCLL